MEYSEFLKNILSKLKEIGSFKGRQDFLNQTLTRIGSGSGRIVYDIDGQKVVKLAKNTKGIAQNNEEQSLGNDYYLKNIVSEVFDGDDNGLWIISEKAKKVTEKRIKELTGIPSLHLLGIYLSNTVNLYNGRRVNYGLDNKVKEFFDENEFAIELVDMAMNYGQSVGDMNRPSTYGEVLRDGQPTIILTDYGLSEEVYDTHYSPQRKQRMYELFNFADGNDDILSDIGNTGEIRHGMWAQIPYDSGVDAVNEEFVDFVVGRDRYPNQPTPSMPIMLEAFHECVNNVKEYLNHVDDKKKFYENLLKLQEYLISQGAYKRDELGEVVYGIRKDGINEDGESLYSFSNSIGQDGFPVFNPIDSSPSIKNDLDANRVNYNEDLEYNHVDDATKDEYVLSEGINLNIANDIAIKISKKLGLNIGKLLDSGFFGVAFDIGGDKVLKITTDKSEAYETSRLVGEKLNYIAEPYNVFRIVSNEIDIPDMYGIILEKLKPVNVSNIKNIMKNLDKYFKEHIGDGLANIILDYIIGYIDETDKEIVDKILTRGDDISNYLESILKISREAKNYGVESVDYINPLNLGYKKNGNLGFFDVGFGNGFAEPSVPSIEINERVRHWVKGGKGVVVKDKCRLGGLGNTSAACNQGDINNFDFNNIDEMVRYKIPRKPSGVENNNYWDWEKNQLPKYAIKIANILRNKKNYLSEDDVNDLIHMYEILRKYKYYDANYTNRTQHELLALFYIFGRINLTSTWLTILKDEGLINNLNEEIDASEAYTDDGALKTLINGKRDVGLIATYHKPRMEKRLRKSGLNLLSIQQRNHDIGMTIVYSNKGKQNAEKLYKFMMSRGGYLSDKTPEEARYIGKLLGYNDISISQYIRKKYGDTDMSNLPPQINPHGKVEFDESVNGNNKIPEEVRKYVQQFKSDEELLRNGGLPTDMLDRWAFGFDETMNQITPKELNIKWKEDYKNVLYEIKKSGLSPKVWADRINLSEPIEVSYDGNNFNIEDGHHRYMAAKILNKPLNMELEIKANPIKPISNLDYDSFHRNLWKNIVGDNENNNNFVPMINEAEILDINELPFKEEVEGLGGKIFSVGGAVRDKFLGKDSKDLDILITGVPFDNLAQLLKKYGEVNPVGKSFGIIKFKPRGASEDIDIAIPRTEKPTGEGGHKGFEVSSSHDLPIEKDLERRDFTINAIAKDSNGNIIDPYGGQEDLKNKIIRVVNPQAFADDPLRMLRAIQFAARFNFTIEPETMKLIQQNANRINEIPAERILTEFDKIVKKGNSRIGAQLLKDTGVYNQIFGVDLNQLTIDRNPFEKIKSMGEFIFLLTKSMKNPSEFYLNRFSTEDSKRDKIYKEIKALSFAFDNRAGNPVVARSTVYNMNSIAPDTLNSAIVPEAVLKAANELNSGEYPKTLRDLDIDGNDLIKLGLKGKQVGDMMKQLLIRVYADKVKNNKEDLLSQINRADANGNIVDDNISYSGVILTEESHNKLIKVLKPMIPEGWDIYAHHMTINLGKINSEQKEDLGKEVVLDVISYGLGEKVMAVGVSGYPSKNENPHITIAVDTNNGGSPSMSKDIQEWKKLSVKLNVKGVIEEVKFNEDKTTNTMNEDDSVVLNESTKKSKYKNVKKSIQLSKSIGKEMKEEILKYITSGSAYKEGGRVLGLSKPQKLRDKSNKINGVSMGADKNGFFVYTHRARSKSHPTPEQITVKEINFIETTG